VGFPTSAQAARAWLREKTLQKTLELVTTEPGLSIPKPASPPPLTTSHSNTPSPVTTDTHKGLKKVTSHPLPDASGSHTMTGSENTPRCPPGGLLSPSSFPFPSSQSLRLHLACAVQGQTCPEVCSLLCEQPEVHCLNGDQRLAKSWLDPNTQRWLNASPSFLKVWS
jgi:hypothetical protein